MSQSTEFQTPVLFLIFNRPKLTSKVFAEIKKVKPTKLYIAADGPKTNEDELLCLQSRRAVLDAINWPCQVETLLRKSNHGCGKAVSSAINWFFEQEEMGIILEDDCLPNNSFFNFCDTMLRKYRDDHRVFHISGSQFLPTKTDEYNYEYSQLPSIWGWATWRRAWQHYNFSLKSWPQIKMTARHKQFCRNIKIRLLREIQFDSVINQRIDTWDYQWQYTLATQNGLVIRPLSNLTKNIGIHGTHITSYDRRFSVPLQSLATPYKSPQFLRVNEKREKAYSETFLEKSHLSLIVQKLALRKNK